MTEGARYRVGLIGCGYWGPNLLRNLLAHPRIEVARVADKDPARQAFVRAWGAPLTIDEDEQPVLSDDSLDAVVIATEARSHAELVRRTLEAGRHVLVEKPLALSTAEARSLGDLAASSDLQLLVGHTFLYNPAVIRLRELIGSGELGEIRYLCSQRLNLGKVRADIGVIWNLGPHDVSILMFLMPEARIEAVRAQTASFLQAGIEDVAFILLELSDGRVAHVHLSWLDPSKVRRMTVVGSKKMAVYDDVAEDKLRIFDSGIDRADLSPHMGDFSSFGEFQLLTRTGDVFLPRLPAVEPLAAEVDHFIRCLDGETLPRSDAAHATDVVRVLEAAIESAANGAARIEL